MSYWGFVSHKSIFGIHTHTTHTSMKIMYWLNDCLMTPHHKNKSAIWCQNFIYSQTYIYQPLKGHYWQVTFLYRSRNRIHLLTYITFVIKKKNLQHQNDQWSLDSCFLKLKPYNFSVALRCKHSLKHFFLNLTDLLETYNSSNITLYLLINQFIYLCIYLSVYLSIYIYPKI